MDIWLIVVRISRYFSMGIGEEENYKFYNLVRKGNLILVKKFLCRNLF